jgi:hypothetical protein
MFMRPGKNPRLEEAILSVLAGDVFGASKIGARLAVFKTIYFVEALCLRAASFLTRRRRKTAVALGTGDS